MLYHSPPEVSACKCSESFLTSSIPNQNINIQNGNNNSAQSIFNYNLPIYVSQYNIQV